MLTTGLVSEYLKDDLNRETGLARKDAAKFV